MTIHQLPNLLVFIFFHYTWLICLSVFSYILGFRLSKDIPYSSVYEEASFCIGLGLGSYGIMTFIIGLAGWLNTSIVTLILILPQLVCYRTWVMLLKRIRVVLGQPSSKFKFFFLLLSALLISYCFFCLPLYPPTRCDATMYHLSYAKLYLQHQQVIVTPFLRYAVSPQINEILFTLSMLYIDDLAAQMIQFLMMILTGLALYAWGKRTFSSEVGILAAALWFGTRWVLLLGSSAYIDIGLALFVCLSTYALFNFMQCKDKTWLRLSAIFCGFAVGSKYSALIFPSVFGAIVLFIDLREQRSHYFIRYTAIITTIALPWYLRNLYATGNPVFPFFSSIFGYSLWSPSDLHLQMQDWVTAGIWGKGFSLKGLVFPSLYLSPLALIFGIRCRFIRQLMGIIIVYLFFWLSTAPLARYLMPIWPLLSLVVAASLDLFFSRLPDLNQVILKKCITILLVVIFMSPNWLYATKELIREPIPITKKQREQYLSKNLTSYSAYKFLNEFAGRDYHLYALYDENMAYFADGVFMGDWFGPARYSGILSVLADGSKLFEALKRFEADYFLCRTDRFKVELPKDSFFQSHFRLIFDNQHVKVFAIQ